MKLPDGWKERREKRKSGENFKSAFHELKEIPKNVELKQKL